MIAITFIRAYQYMIVCSYYYLCMVDCQCSFLSGIDYQCHMLLNMVQMLPMLSMTPQLKTHWWSIQYPTRNQTCRLTLTVSSLTGGSRARQITIVKHWANTSIGIASPWACTPIIPCCPCPLNWKNEMDFSILEEIWNAKWVVVWP